MDITSEIYKNLQIPELEQLKNVTVLITGATGFIGSLLVNSLLYFNQVHGTNIDILACVRDLDKAKNILKNDNRIELINCDLEHVSLKTFADYKIDYIFHCASVTKSSQMISNPIEVADGIVIGTRNILEIAKEKHVKSMVYLSSMEIYGDIKDTGSLVNEEALGNIDLFSTRSCYPLGKRMAEHYCCLNYKEYGVNVKIARLAQTFGVGVLKGDNRVFIQFANAVRNNEDIRLNTNGASMGNYCESIDTINALFTILLKGDNGEAYNVVNEENTMRIRDMAEIIAEKTAGGKINVIFDIFEENVHGYAPYTGLRLSSAKLRALGWQPTKNLEEMYKEMIQWMNQNGI